MSQDSARKPADPAVAKAEGSAKGVTHITSGEADPIGAELRRLYNDAATEPLPDHLLELLEQLQASEDHE